MFARAFARRCGACLALVALLLQLALSFAHVHKHDLAFSGFNRSDVVSAGPARPTRQAVTQQPSRLADDDDHCPICFSGFLLSNSSLPDAPVTCVRCNSPRLTVGSIRFPTRWFNRATWHSCRARPPSP